MKLHTEVTKENGLMQINEDCLVLIFKQLTVGEQYVLYQLSADYRYAVLHIWRCNYRQQLNIQQENSLKLLKNNDLSVALSILLGCTRELLNVDAITCDALVALATRHSAMVFRNIKKLSTYDIVNFYKIPKCVYQMFPCLNSLQLSRCSLSVLEVLRDYRNLTDLRLHQCTFHGHNEWCVHEIDEAFQQLRLQTFCCTPEPQIYTSLLTARTRHALQRSCIKHCSSTLNTLQLDAGDLMAVITDVAQLPNLRKLTVFTHSAAISRISHDGAGRNDDAIAHKRIIAALKATTTTTTSTTTPATALRTCRTVKILRVKCHFDRYFLQQLLPLPNLCIFAWHSHLHVEQQLGGEIEWQTYDASATTPALLQFIEACGNLSCLDLRWNSHVKAEFLKTVHRILCDRTQHPNAVHCDADSKWHSNLVCYSHFTSMQDFVETYFVAHTAQKYDYNENLGFYEFEFELSRKE